MKQDKKMHVVCGAVIGAVVASGVNPIAGVIAATVIGAGKELVYACLMGKGTPEWADFIATVGGGVMGSVAANLVLGGAVWPGLK